MDYSENRKVSLKRDMKFTNNEEQAKELFYIKVKNKIVGTKGEFKRGWKDYSISEF